MKNRVIWSVLGVVALGSGGLIAGCDSDAKLARSALGESCDNTASCEDGLRCIDGTCAQKGSSSSSGGSSGTGTGAGGEPATGATAGTAPIAKPPVLGGPGESCTKRADCEDGLGCFSQRCQEDSSGQGGGGGSGSTLGGVGETCGLTSDCEAGLRCLPQGGSVSLKSIGSNSVGVCTQLDSGLAPTGKVCGAECVEAADCCELPIAQQTATGAASCTDLAELVGNVTNCATAKGQAGIQCLAFQVYCDDNCGAKTWSCTNGACIYEAKCTVEGEIIGGCPTLTRGGTPIPGCDTGGTKKCTGKYASATGCKNDDDCTATEVYDHPTDTCVEGECTCQQSTGRCYRKCSEPLDCQVGYTCNDASLCVPVPLCTEDLQCIREMGNINAKCSDTGCVIPCEHDVDCPANEGGLTNGVFSQVCGPDKVCVSLGCQSDDECGQFGESGVRSFCAEPVLPPTVEGVVASAITD
jgi:hypothetical protein